MHALRLTICVITFFLSGSLTKFLSGQEAGADTDSAETADSVVELDDPRVVELKRNHDQRVRELREQLIADIEKLGSVKTPKHLEFVEQNRGRWSWSGSLSGLANHSVRIRASDVEETESWHPSLGTPPLDARAAMVVADETMRSWFEGEETTFELQRIALVPLNPTAGKWYWEALYEVKRGSSDKEFTLAIRMDGKVLTHFRSKVRDER